MTIRVFLIGFREKSRLLPAADRPLRRGFGSSVAQRLCPRLGTDALNPDSRSSLPSSCSSDGPDGEQVQDKKRRREVKERLGFFGS